MTLSLDYAALSDVGRVRRNNEDSAYAGPHLQSLIVDAGLKASSVDSGLPRIADDGAAEYVKASDEHGVIQVNGAPGFAVDRKSVV
jgi:hypothetical protein